MSWLIFMTFTALEVGDFCHVCGVWRGCCVASDHIAKSRCEESSADGIYVKI